MNNNNVSALVAAILHADSFRCGMRDRNMTFTQLTSSSVTAKVVIIYLIRLALKYLLSGRRHIYGDVRDEGESPDWTPAVTLEATSLKL